VCSAVAFNSQLGTDTPAACGNRPRISRLSDRASIRFLGFTRPYPHGGPGMGSISPVHWLIVIVVVLLLFGPSRLAAIGKSVGEGIRGLKKGLTDDPTDSKQDAKRL
jgi:sec-independent protein translocase protein TatA